VSGEEDNGNMRKHLLDSLLELETVDTRHPEIDDRAGELFTSSIGQKVIRRSKRNYVVTSDLIRRTRDSLKEASSSIMATATPEFISCPKLKYIPNFDVRPVK
jgi:hypothetical protein